MDKLQKNPKKLLYQLNGNRIYLILLYSPGQPSECYFCSCHSTKKLLIASVRATSSPSIIVSIFLSTVCYHYLICVSSSGFVMDLAFPFSLFSTFLIDKTRVAGIVLYEMRTSRECKNVVNVTSPFLDHHSGSLPSSLETFPEKGFPCIVKKERLDYHVVKHESKKKLSCAENIFSSYAEQKAMFSQNTSWMFFFFQAHLGEL